MKTWIAVGTGILSIAFLAGCEISDTIPQEGDVAAGESRATQPGENDSGGGTSDPGSPINLANVRWLDTNISSWAQTATLNASLSGGTLVLNYDKANAWPTARTRASDGGPLVGNVWIFVNRNGTWYGATWDWMRRGQTSKAKNSVRGTGGHIPQAPLNTFTPSPGQTYGFMVSTVARGGERTINERSNVSMVVWE